MPSIPWVGSLHQTPRAWPQQPPAPTIHPLADNFPFSGPDVAHVEERLMLHGHKRFSMYGTSRLPH